MGVSSCLLGARVRYDGGHKRDAALVDELGQLVEWVPVCPEAEVGMGIPRESLRLVRGAGPRLRLVGNVGGADWTERMNRFAADRLPALDDLVGYVLKSRSPSCGLGSVKVYDGPASSEPAHAEGDGLFAAALRARFPGMPIEEAERLHDRAARARFLERVADYARRRGYL